MIKFLSVFFLLLAIYLVDNPLFAQQGCKYGGNYSSILAEVNKRTQNAASKEDRLTDEEARKIARYWELDCKCRGGVASEAEAQSLSNEAFKNTSNTFYKGYGVNRAKKNLDYLGDLETPFAVFTPNECLNPNGNFGQSLSSGVSCAPESSRITELDGQLGAYASAFFQAYCKCKRGVSSEDEERIVLAQMKTNFSNFNRMRNRATPSLSTQPLTSCQITSSTVSGGAGFQTGGLPSDNIRYSRTATRRYAEEQLYPENQRLAVREAMAGYEEQRRRSTNLGDATDISATQLGDALVNSNDPSAAIKAVQPLAQEFARQGSAVGAYGTIGVGVAAGVGKLVFGNKKKKQEQQRLQQEADRQWEIEEAERIAEEQRKQAILDQMFDQRMTLLEAYNKSMPIPLSTASISGNKVYYFLYSYTPEILQQEVSRIFVSNVFALERYQDGSWPYQSQIQTEIQRIRPASQVVMHGYYMTPEEAEEVLDQFIADLLTFGGVMANQEIKVNQFEYRKDSFSTGKETHKKEESPLGIPLNLDSNKKKFNNTSKPSSTNTKKNTGLGIPIE